MIFINDITMHDSFNEIKFNCAYHLDEICIIGVRGNFHLSLNYLFRIPAVLLMFRIMREREKHRFEIKL